MRLLAPLVLVLLAGCVQPDAPEFTPDAPSHPAPPPAPSTPAQPYAGEESREIKALSPEEVDGYRSGAGLGYAKSAELNSYPGPLHALEMADRLELSAEQRAEIQRLREEVLAKVVPLGERYLDAEAAIEDHFREGSADPETLRELLAESAFAEAELRYAHLEAHLATRALLSEHQVALYDQARGYGTAEHDSHEHGA